MPRSLVLRVLTVNAGSSSVKLDLVGEGDEVLASAELQAPRAELDRSALAAAIDGPLREADAVAHRVVHGGERFLGPVRVDDEVVAALDALTDLAPLHQPKSLAAMRAVGELLGHLPAVACFDTAFHATIPAANRTYALPAAWRERWGLRRFGFHGLSHGWVARRAPELLRRTAAGPGPDDGAPRIVSCHLGAGASLCAIRGGASVDTTMGFTPLEGLVMATRSGSVDPGLLLWLLEHERLSEHEMATALEHDSGLQGLAGSADMQEVLARAAAGEQRAGLAIDVYIHRLTGQIAAMVAALGGIDALVFTAGVGEHAPEIRARAAQGLRFLGVALDGEANRACAGDCEIGDPSAAVRTLVLTAREDAEMARQARTVLA